MYIDTYIYIEICIYIYMYVCMDIFGCTMDIYIYIKI